MGKEDTNDSNSDEAALFRKAVGEVRPVRSRRAHREAPGPAPRAERRRQDERAVLAESLHLPPDTADVETGEELVFRRAGISDRVFRKLRRGEYAVRDEIDLHGLRSDEALVELRGFIAECVVHRVQCVRVIHGKGLGSGQRGPVLKNRVNAWLRRWDAVLAFCSAQARHGGTGAVYVLLRR